MVATPLGCNFEWLVMFFLAPQVVVAFRSFIGSKARPTSVLVESTLADESSVVH